MNQDWSYFPTALEVEAEIGVCPKRKVSCEPRLKLLSNSSRGWGWDLDPLNFFDPCETDKGLNYFFPSRLRLRISCQFFSDTLETEIAQNSVTKKVWDWDHSNSWKNAKITSRSCIEVMNWGWKLHFFLKNGPFLALFCLFFVFPQPWMYWWQKKFSTRLRFFRFYPPCNRLRSRLGHE